MVLSHCWFDYYLRSRKGYCPLCVRPCPAHSFINSSGHSHSSQNSTVFDLIAEVAVSIHLGNVHIMSFIFNINVAINYPFSLDTKSPLEYHFSIILQCRLQFLLMAHTKHLSFLSSSSSYRILQSGSLSPLGILWKG